MSNTQKRRVVALSLTPEQFSLLERLMKEQHQTNFTAYMVYLMAQEEKRLKEEGSKRGPGRPAKADEGREEEEPRDIPHPDQVMNPGKLITKSELDAYEAMRGGSLSKS